MFSFVTHSLQPALGLVAVLHGCGQAAADYDLGAGWSTLAKHYGFVLLMPEQQPSNKNANGCFNWFNPEDTARGRGEASSIRQTSWSVHRKRGLLPVICLWDSSP